MSRQSPIEAADNQAIRIGRGIQAMIGGEEEMPKQNVTQPTYMVSINADPDVPGALRFTFVPKSIRRPRSNGEPTRSPPEYVASVQGHGDATSFNWIAPPTDERTRDELEEIARQRITARDQWIEKLGKLAAMVEGWAEEFDWATRIVNKKMEDAEIGDYAAPGLLLQKETVRLFLEPVARVAPGTEGIVDLYMMPSYDDIASLYYYDNRWNVHYALHGASAVDKGREAEAKPLTKATFRKVLDEMQAHAG